MPLVVDGPGHLIHVLAALQAVHTHELLGRTPVVRMFVSTNARVDGCNLILWEPLHMSTLQASKANHGSIGAGSRKLRALCASCG